jgi:Raf kinase inhibitor-like YbhB/YbcL family protein
MKLTSTAFTEGEAIPIKYTCEGDNISPQLSWLDPPKETKSYVLLLHDPDARGGEGFTHWVFYDIPANVNSIRENIPRNEMSADVGIQGRNDSGAMGYTGPCPPAGSHRYFFRLYALWKTLDLPRGASAEQVEAAMAGKVVDQTALMGTYAKARAAAA